MAKSEYWFKMAEEDLRDASLDVDHGRVLELMVIRGNKFQLSPREMETLGQIVNYSKLLESQKESPRYGWETVDKITNAVSVRDK